MVFITIKHFFHTPRFVPPRSNKNKIENTTKKCHPTFPLCTRNITKYLPCYYYYKGTMTVYATYLQVAAIKQLYTIIILLLCYTMYCAHARCKPTFPNTVCMIVVIYLPLRTEMRSEYRFGVISERCP